MIQINLLPDVKLEYLKSQGRKRIIVVFASLASVISVAIAVIVWVFTVGQNVHLNNLQDDIDRGVSELQAVNDLDKVVTVQNQLSTIQELYDQKPEASLLFDYLTILTPNDIELGSVDIDFAELLSIEITGVGPGFKEINTFADALKNAEFSFKDSEGNLKAFSSVVVSSSGSDEDGDTGFKIDLIFDEQIFDNNLEELVLRVPSITSTQSETERPKDLFVPSAQQTETEEEEAPAEPSSEETSQ